ncbi:hypothetical protein AGMMS49921_12460 [Endomicrobiia bacterium]|nr:hypothetical protein AGMMS49921_12460 [Endomicrobiia bacterium]
MEKDGRENLKQRQMNLNSKATSPVIGGTESGKRMEQQMDLKLEQMRQVDMELDLDLKQRHR